MAVTTIHPDQITAAEAVLRPYITDSSVSVAGLALQVVNAYLEAKPIRRREGSTQTKNRIGDDFPGETEKQKAIVYWGRKRRPDLVARVEEIAEQFHAYHLGKGTRAENWPSTWQTWASNAIEFNKPPRDGDLFLASVTPLIENCNIAGWVSRLECWWGDNDAKAGTWSAKWGGKPGVKPSDTIPENCACPAQAFALYLENKRRRA